MLAEDFLNDAEMPGMSGREGKCDQLAQEIQDVIEAFIAKTRDNYEPPDVPGWEGGFAENH